MDDKDGGLHLPPQETLIDPVRMRPSIQAWISDSLHPTA
jgi:hypothetical protein